jgi:hypothetical protein
MLFSSVCEIFYVQTIRHLTIWPPYSSPPYNSPPLHFATLQLAIITIRNQLHLATVIFRHHYIL